MKTFELIFRETGWEKVSLWVSRGRATFDFKLGNCFDISVEGAIYHRSDLQLHLRRLSFGYKVFREDFWGYLGIFLRIFLNIVYIGQHIVI